jgi:hypothetical protein
MIRIQVVDFFVALGVDTAVMRFNERHSRAERVLDKPLSRAVDYTF